MKIKQLMWLFVPIFSACGVAPIDSATKAKDDVEMERAKATMNSSLYTKNRNEVRQNSLVKIPVIESKSIDSEFKSAETAWLTNKRVRINLNQPVPLSQIVKMLYAQGININSTLPIDGYTYGGLGVNETNAEAALKIILSSVGLDYELDNVNKLVFIKPMQSKTWYMNLGSRTSAFNSGGGSGQQSQSQSQGQAQGLGQGNNGAGSIPSALQTGNSGSSGTTINSSDNFWVSLKAELTGRLSILVPSNDRSNTTNPAASGLPTPIGARDPLPNAVSNQAPVSGGQGAMYVSKQVGSFTLNAETGAITIQAPHWILSDLDAYLKRVEAMYNVDITFTSELLMVTHDSNATEGLDIASFGRFAATNYGVGLQNNSLGGVTISQPTVAGAAPSIVSGKSPISGTLFGLSNMVTGFQMFNAYLSNHGTVSVLQKPIMTTTSGVPVEFSKIVTEYFNSVSQQASSGATGSASTATQNTLVPVDLGTTIKINPRFDVSTGLIRAQISLYQSVKSGKQTVSQSLSAGNTVQQVALDIPILTKLNYSGEALLQDGDLIIIGGQTDNTNNNSSDGVTGLKDTFLSPVFGNKAKSTRVSTYYFAMRVTTHKRY